MTARPRLLFLAQILPYPADSGVAIRTHHVLRLLARSYDVTALCFYRKRAQWSRAKVEESLAALRQFGQVEAFPIPHEHSRARMAVDHLRSVAGGRAYTTYAYESRDFRRRLGEVLRSGGFSLVHVDSLDLATYLPMLSGLPVVCVHHNVESKLMVRRAQMERVGWKRRYLAYQSRLIEREERYWCDRVALNVAVSQVDRTELQELAPRARFAVVPNGVDVDEFTPADGPQASIAYMGGTEWFPNVDALDFFCEEILPRIREQGVTPAVRWIGRADPDEQSRYRAKYGVELTGYVDDIRPYVHDAACTVVPLRIGGGTRLKITTGWALGKAIVSTSLGCEGLVANDGDNILIRDSADGFAEAVVSLLRDPDLRGRLGSAGRATAEEHYSWDVIGTSMVREYERLLK